MAFSSKMLKLTRTAFRDLILRISQPREILFDDDNDNIMKRKEIEISHGWRERKITINLILETRLGCWE